MDNNNNTVDDAEWSETQSARIQNFLICLEMLFFSLAHYCVFPVEEWAPDYRPKSVYAKPGFGLKDFASDLSFIVTSSSQARKYRRFHENNSSVLPTSSSLSREEDYNDDESESTTRDPNGASADNRNEDVVMVLNDTHAMDEGSMIPGLPDNFSYRDGDVDNDDDPRELT